MSSVLQIMALPVPPLIVTLLLIFKLNFASLQEILRPGANTVNNFDRSQFKEPLLPAFVPGVSNKFNNGYEKGNLYWWPPASSRERPSTLSPNFTQSTQTNFEAYNPKTHSGAPTITFEEDSQVLPIKSTETTTIISQISNVIEGRYNI